MTAVPLEDAVRAQCCPQGQPLAQRDAPGSRNLTSAVPSNDTSISERDVFLFCFINMCFERRRKPQTHIPRLK